MIRAFFGFLGRAIPLVQCAALLLVAACAVFGVWLAFISMQTEVQLKAIDGAVAAWIGFVDLCKSAIASPSFWMAAGGLGAWFQSWVNGRKAKEAVEAAKGAVVAAQGAEEKVKDAHTTLVKKIEENTQLTVSVKEAAVRSKHEVTDAFTAGQRNGFVGGIAEGKKQASGPAPLQADFDPMCTDMIDVTKG